MNGIPPQVLQWLQKLWGGSALLQRPPMPETMPQFGQPPNAGLDPWPYAQQAQHGQGQQGLLHQPTAPLVASETGMPPWPGLHTGTGAVQHPMALLAGLPKGMQRMLG